MAFIQFQIRFSLLLTLLCLSVLPPLCPPPSTTSSAPTASPPGSSPKEVKSFSLSETGLLEVYLDKPCLAKFDTMAFYETVVRANLTYRSLSGMEGLSQEELFLWLPVKDIVVYDPKSGLILFDIGVAHKQLSLSLFEDPPHCKPDGGVLKTNARKERGFEGQRYKFPKF